MNLKQVRIALYSLYLTNLYGFKLKRATSNEARKRLRFEYASTLLGRLNIGINATGLDKIDSGKQYLLLSNHRSIIDPCIIEIALKDTDMLGLWVSKKELYNSFFFGKFVRNAGSILIDRSSNKMSPFFKEIKNGLSSGASIFIFPEGTRNTSDSALCEFKKGTELIALKNRLPIIPVYIKTNSRDTLHTAIKKREKGLQIDIEFGDVIDFRSRGDSLEQQYRDLFITA